MEQRKKDLKLYYFTISIVVSLFTSFLPMMYNSSGLSALRIGLLISTTYFGASLQPVFGYISDKTQKPKLILKILIISAIILSSLLLFVANFYLLFITVLLLAICYCSYFSLSDNVITAFVDRKNWNYGKIRAYASIGYGSALLIVSPFVQIWGQKIFIIIAIICLIIAWNKIDKIEYLPVEKTEDDSYHKDVLELLKTPTIILLLLFQASFLGMSSLKFGYQAIKLQQLTATTIVSSIALLCSTFPEVFLLPVVSGKVKNNRYTTILLIALIANLIHVCTYAFSNNVVILIIGSMFHGISLSCFLPVLPQFLRKITNLRVIGLAFTIGATLQGLVALVVSVMIITPTYAKFGVGAVFMIIGSLMFLSITFIAILRYKYHY